jgi:hypothetical protein
MAARWYIARGGKGRGPVFREALGGGSIGPLSAARLLELATGGVVSAEDWLAEWHGCAHDRRAVCGPGPRRQPAR